MGTEIIEAFAVLKELIERAEEDVAKARQGNYAAGTRVRVTMQRVKEAAQAVRVAIGEQRDKAL